MFVSWLAFIRKKTYNKVFQLVKGKDKNFISFRFGQNGQNVKLKQNISRIMKFQCLHRNMSKHYETF